MDTTETHCACGQFQFRCRIVGTLVITHTLAGEPIEACPHCDRSLHKLFSLPVERYAVGPLAASKRGVARAGKRSTTQG